MSKTIELPDELFVRLETTAAAEGLTPKGWIDARLSANGNGEAAYGTREPRTLADLFAGRVGRFSSGHGEPRLEDLRESFGEYLEDKHRKGHL